MTTVFYGAVPTYVDSLLGKGIHRERDQKIWPNPAPNVKTHAYRLDHHLDPHAAFTAAITGGIFMHT